MSALLALLIGMALLAGIGYFVSWQITEHSGELGDQIIQLVDQTRGWLHNGPLHLKSKDIDKLTQNITELDQEEPGALISGAIQTVRTVVEVLGALLLVLLSTFFLLRDGDADLELDAAAAPAPARSTGGPRRPGRLAHAGRLHARLADRSRCSTASR